MKFTVRVLRHANQGRNPQSTTTQYPIPISVPYVPWPAILEYSTRPSIVLRAPYYDH